MFRAMDFGGYRCTVVEGKIDECLDSYRQGAKVAAIDRDDLTDEEIAYIRSEVKRRIESDLV